MIAATPLVPSPAFPFNMGDPNEDLNPLLFVGVLPSVICSSILVSLVSVSETVLPESFHDQLFLIVLSIQNLVILLENHHNP